MVDGYQANFGGFALSPDSRYFAVRSNNPNAPFIWLADPSSGSIITRLKGRSAGVTALAFNPSSTVLAAGCGDGWIRLWNIPEGSKGLRLKGHAGTVRCLAFSPDGSVVASAGDAVIHVWDTYTGREVRQIAGHAMQTWTVAFSSDGQLIASGSTDGTIRLWHR